MGRGTYGSSLSGKGYLQKRRVERDISKLSDALYWDILKSPRQHAYDDKEIRKIGVVLDQGFDDLSGVDKSKCDERVKSALEMVEAIGRGEFVDMKKVSLDKSNPYVVKNWLNFLDTEPERARACRRDPAKGRGVRRVGRACRDEEVR